MAPSHAMGLYNPLFLVGIVAIALGCARIASAWLPPPVGARERARSIDGLRGYLAIGVFVHHGAIWHDYAVTGRWVPPPSVLFAQLGKVSVAAFFMVTAFLFASKVFRSSKLDWRDLLASRVLRLFPLYAAVMAACFVVTAFKTGFELREPPGELLANAFQWLAFSLGGTPPVNGFGEFSTLTASATWTLPYEWAFYFFLPVLAWLMRRKVPTPTWVIGFGAFLVVAIIGRLSSGWGFAAFGAGVLAAWLCRRFEGLGHFARKGGAASALVAGGICTALMSPATGWSIAALAVAFTLIAAGCDLFGILSWRASQALGELTYSIYLLHGLVLYVAFDGLVRRAGLAGMAPLVHWSLVAGLTPLLVLLSAFTFMRIERPALERRAAFAGWLQGSAAASAP